MVPDPDVGKESRKTVDTFTSKISSAFTSVLLSLPMSVPKLIVGLVQEITPSNARTGNR
jgi:hypothetical protein